jgi:hypothetical protein
MSVSLLIKKLNQNPIFKYISSVRLAVPLMLILGGLVAYGTIVESNYNAEYASMAIYKTGWFGLLIILLWINIFAATISRIPFKLHHTGFVITHIGLLTLLIGGYLTNTEGIDGQLIIPENQSSSTVILPHLMVGYQFEGSPSPQIIKFKKTISEQDQDDLSSINGLIGHLFEVKKYIPFAKVENSYIESKNPQDQAVAISFILKSNFFNVTEWLHSDKKTEMKMGPALLRVVKTDDINRPLMPDSKTKSTSKKRQINSEPKTQPRSSASGPSSEATLVIRSIKNPDEMKKIKLSSLLKGKQTFNGIDFQLVKYFKHAVVSENKMIESDDPTHNNPALELSISKGSEKFREVLYAKFAGFSLNQSGLFGYKFSFEGGDPDLVVQSSVAHGQPQATEPATENVEADMTSRAQAAMSGDNTVVFSIDPKEKTKARVTLIKNKEVVMSEILSEGQNLQTPWMGMKIFLGSIKTNATERMTAIAINPEKSQQLPPSALLIGSAGADSSDPEFWLAEGEQKQIRLAGKSAAIYFGRQTIELPFELKLEKFSKVDYPGTSTPMSFESRVQIGSTGITQVISMNEPLKMDGYTVYQASYSITPEQTLSIFSVNKDPGRFLKYLGSLILGLGIITITLMRSRVWKNYLQRKTQHA